MQGTAGRAPEPEQLSTRETGSVRMCGGRAGAGLPAGFVARGGNSVRFLAEPCRAGCLRAGGVCTTQDGPRSTPGVQGPEASERLPGAARSSAPSGLTTAPRSAASAPLRSRRPSVCPRASAHVPADGNHAGSIFSRLVYVTISQVRPCWTASRNLRTFRTSSAASYTQSSVVRPSVSPTGHSAVLHPSFYVFMTDTRRKGAQAGEGQREKLAPR